MDRNIKEWITGWVYCFHDKLTAAKTGLRAKSDNCEIEYMINEHGNPSFKIISKHERKGD